MSAKSPFPLMLPPRLVATAVATALAEDLGQAGDITTDAIVPAEAKGEAAIVARQAGVIAGLDLAEAAFRALDPETRFIRVVADGGGVASGGTIATVAGKTRALLTAERTALNFLGRLSGIATLTASYVKAVEGTGAGIACTRKTTPGLRAFEKYAVRAGGGVNHRFGLYDAVLVKDNHIAAAGGLAKALDRLRARSGHVVEVEVDTLDQLEEAFSFPIDAVLLDNMDVDTLRRAVKLVAGRVTTEASGGVTLENVREIAETGVDLISIGALTHSPRNLDSSLEWKSQSRSRSPPIPTKEQA
jgi:nicotinate-nucleotide pyrophosphorylase (carboxylating)